MRFEKDRFFLRPRTEDVEVVLYIHGKGGNAEEAEHYRQFFPKKDIYGFDYKSQNPWETKKEFGDMVAELSEKYNRITLIAVSIGAYFSMNVIPKRSVLIEGKGYGHGVGMSQIAADQMAKEGYTCEEILNYFFKDIEIIRLDGVL